MKILIAIWELPQMILACVLLVFLKKKITGHKIYRRAKVFYIRGFYGGISLGRYIILNDRYTGNELSLKHEYGHTMQSLYLGWSYLVVVGIPSLARSIIWGLFKLNGLRYYKGYPENWANRLGLGKKGPGRQ
jgi:hypothetical protein